MRKLVLSIFAALTMGVASAQLPNNSIAPDFNATDLNGNNYNLYDLLDQGMTVFLDVSATWCGPCWNYHNTHKLRDLYDQYGPNGTITPNKVMVFFAEGDNATNLACLSGPNGCVGGTQGNWVTGTTYPIIHQQGPAIGNAYQISFFPTLYVICPNRIVNQFAQNLTVAQLYALATACPVATQQVDAAILQYTGTEGVCAGEQVQIKVQLQNMGLTNLTNVTIAATDNGNQVASTTFNGNLATYGMQEVTVGTITLNNTMNLNITATVNGDANANNNAVSKQLVPGPTAAGTNVTFTIRTDSYAEETAWELRNSLGALIANHQYVANTDDNLVFNYPWTLDPNDCYTLTVTDAYGDGICCGYGQGYYRVTDTQNNNANLINVTGQNASFSERNDKMKSGAAVDVQIVTAPAEQIRVFPNPASNDITLEYTLTDAANVTIEMVNMMGQTIRAIESADRTAGTYQINASVADLPSGAYSFVIRTGNEVSVKRFTVQK